MTTWFVSRHQGAAAWATAQGFAVDRQVTHLDPTEVSHGDVVLGSLPVNLAAVVCARGARYLHLSLDLPLELRGCELTSQEMATHGARIEEYRVTWIGAE